MTNGQNKASFPRFSLSIDDVIIDGFFADQEAMFRRMEALGFSRDEITVRIKQLGLSVLLAKRCSTDNANVAMRECLRCSERFLSTGFQNRLCNRCRSRQ